MEGCGDVSSRLVQVFNAAKGTPVVLVRHVSGIVRAGFHSARSHGRFGSHCSEDYYFDSCLGPGRERRSGGTVHAAPWQRSRRINPPIVHPVVPRRAQAWLALHSRHRRSGRRQILKLRCREFVLIGKRDADDGAYAGLAVQNGQRNGSLRVYSLRARLHISGIVFFQIACLNGFFALQRKSSHALTVRHPRHDFLNRRRDINGAYEL